MFERLLSADLCNHVTCNCTRSVLIDVLNKVQDRHIASVSVETVITVSAWFRFRPKSKMQFRRQFRLRP